LLASLADSGQQTPIVVVVSQDNRERYLVIDGHKRVAALKQLASNATGSSGGSAGPPLHQRGRTLGQRTNIEGEWDEVFAAIKRCHEVVHAMGTPRISSTLRFGTRIDRPQSMDDKVRSVEEKLAAGRLNVD
jgi:hypothetical protein